MNVCQQCMNNKHCVISEIPKDEISSSTDDTRKQLK